MFVKPVGEALAGVPGLDVEILLMSARQSFRGRALRSVAIHVDWHRYLFNPFGFANIF